MSTGHVYVVHAALQTVDADVVVVPTDGRFTVNQKWHDLLPGGRRRSATRRAGGRRRRPPGPAAPRVVGTQDLVHRFGPTPG